MKNLFEQSRSHWVRYDRYELKTAADGKWYVTPAKDAKPDVYNPMKEMPGMVLDALNVGMLMMGRRTESQTTALPEMKRPMLPPTKLQTMKTLRRPMPRKVTAA